MLRNRHRRRRPPLVLLPAHKLTGTPTRHPPPAATRTKRVQATLGLDLINILQAAALLILTVAEKKTPSCYLRNRLISRCSRWAPRRLRLSRRLSSPESCKPPRRLKTRDNLINQVFSPCRGRRAIFPTVGRVARMQPAGPPRRQLLNPPSSERAGARLPRLRPRLPIKKKASCLRTGTAPSLCLRRPRCITRQLT